MNQNLTASSTITINSTLEQLWDVLTNPDKIKEYFFGTGVKTDWEVDSPIIFQGEYNGQQYCQPLCGIKKTIV